jgi:hypothetical protein
MAGLGLQPARPRRRVCRLAVFAAPRAKWLLFYQGKMM